jgi:hypothetical protein
LDIHGNWFSARDITFFSKTRYIRAVMFFIVGYLLAGRVGALFLVCLKCQFLKE